MKAAVYRVQGDPDVITYEEIPDPECGDNDVLLRVEAISIEGGDLLYRKRMTPATVPYVPGYSAAGEVIAVGRAVHAFKRGQKVATFSLGGSHASLRAVHQDYCWVLPAGIDMNVAACVPVALGTAYQALFDLGRLEAGQTVLIQGAAGGVGLAAVQLAKRAGARVIGTGSSHEQLDKLRTYGLDEGIDYHTEDVVSRVHALTDNRGVDVALDQLGGASLQIAVDSLADGGRAIMVGMVESGPLIVNAMGLVRGRKSLIGCMLGATMHEPPVHEFIQRLIARVASGEFTVPIAKIFSLEDAPAAHRYAETRGRDIGRVIMRP